MLGDGGATAMWSNVEGLRHKYFVKATDLQYHPGYKNLEKKPKSLGVM